MRDIQTLMRQAYLAQTFGLDAEREWWNDLTADERDALNAHMLAVIETATAAWQLIAEHFLPAFEALAELGRLIPNAVIARFAPSPIAIDRFIVRFWPVLRARGIQPDMQLPHGRHAMRARKMRRYAEAAR